MDHWSSQEGTTVESCAILTTTANELLSDVHDPMPVILRAEDYHQWLATPASNGRRLRHLLIPFQAAEMKRYPVGLTVNDVQNDTPECIQRVPEFIPAQTALF
jgi:putative SOS response-associated peptidase YedK